MQVLLPTYSERLAGDRPAEAGNLALRSALIITLGIAPFVASLMVLSPLISRLYGPEFATGGAVFAVAFLAAGVSAPYGALTNYLVARERMWVRLSINLLWAAALVGGAAVLVRRGALGVAVAMLIAYVIRGTLTYMYARRLIRN
jgi:O-antigen/teichoic acid export membrane protein